MNNTDLIIAVLVLFIIYLLYYGGDFSYFGGNDNDKTIIYWIIDESVDNPLKNYFEQNWGPFVREMKSNPSNNVIPIRINKNAPGNARLVQQFDVPLWSAVYKVKNGVSEKYSGPYEREPFYKWVFA
jgi:hypothetical protein